MTPTHRQRLLGLLLAAALAACSGKKDAPHAAASHPAADTTVTAPAAPAVAAASVPADPPAAIAKKASLDCDDRTVVLEATCTDLNSPRVLACTQQSLTVLDRASGAVRNTRRFAPQPPRDGDPALVEEQVGELTCARAGTNERYIVAGMSNGGNCEQCEWHEAYDWDGKLVASDRDRREPNALLANLLSAQKGRPDAVIAHTELDGFYSGLPQQ